MAVKGKIARGIIDLVRSPFERTIGPDFDPRFDPRKKEQQRLQELTVGVEPRNMDIPEISLQDLEGRPFVTSMSDRTAAGGMLTDVKGRPLESPVDLRGGQDFMFDENAGQVWASGRGPAGAILAAAKRIRRETGQNPLFIPWRMAPTGGDFATMTGETMLSFARDNMSKKNKKALDKALKEVVEGWPGIDSPQAFEAYRNASADARKLAMNSMDVGFRDKGGLSIGEARLAVSDASQLAAQEGGIQNVGNILADRERTIGRATHPSYPFSVPGEGVGRIKEDVNVFQLLPDIVENRGIPDPLNPRATDLRSMQMGAKTGTITPEILRKIFGGGAAVGFGTGLMAPEEAEAAGLGSLIRRGIPESTVQKIVSGELPMDLGSRMVRAKEQRKTQRLYHAGSPELAESLELDPDAGRFGRAGSGTWMSPEPILANTYMPGDISESGTMYQMVVDDSRFPTVFGRGNWDDVEGVLMGPDGEVILDDISGSTNDIARKVREMGYPGLIFNGITDVGPNYRAAKRSSEMIAEQYGMDPADLLRESIGDAADYEVYTVFDPSVARLPSAAFDPEQASSGNLMAGIGAGAVGAGLMAPDRAEASVASPLDRQDDVPDYMRRLDGTVKSERGFLGPIRNNVSGKTMTEVSIGQPGSEEGFYPLLVPTLTAEEVETIANMDLERERPPFSIIEKARAHALERIDRGLSPFYQDGEEGGAARSPLERPEASERRANARAVAVASDTLERLRRERGAVASPLDDTGVYRFGAYLTENRPSEMDPVQRALQSLGLFQGIGEYLRTTGEGQRTTTMQDINAALDIVPL